MIGERAPIFWGACAAIAVGVLLHLPMLAMAHRMNNHLVGMPMDPEMWVGMTLIIGGVPAAIYGALPPRRELHDAHAQTNYEALDSTPLNRWHASVVIVLMVALVIDVMKPATLGFVLPGMASEYGISKATVAWLPFVALVGTTVGSFFWGWLADVYGRRVSILLSTILFVSTSICGAMPLFELNLVMCFLMGSSAGGMLPVVYTLLAEIMPPRHRSWVLVMVGGTGLIGGYLAASGAAHAFEPVFGWRFLWLQGFPNAAGPRSSARCATGSGSSSVPARQGCRPTRPSRSSVTAALPRRSSSPLCLGASSTSACCCGCPATSRRAAIALRWQAESWRVPRSSRSPQSPSRRGCTAGSAANGRSSEPG